MYINIYIYIYVYKNYLYIHTYKYNMEFGLFPSCTEILIQLQSILQTGLPDLRNKPAKLKSNAKTEKKSNSPGNLGRSGTSNLYIIWFKMISKVCNGQTAAARRQVFLLNALFYNCQTCPN